MRQVILKPSPTAGEKNWATYRETLRMGVSKGIKLATSTLSMARVSILSSVTCTRENSGTARHRVELKRTNLGF